MVKHKFAVGDRVQLIVPLPDYLDDEVGQHLLSRGLLEGRVTALDDGLPTLVVGSKTSVLGIYITFDNGYSRGPFYEERFRHTEGPW